MWNPTEITKIISDFTPTHKCLGPCVLFDWERARVSPPALPKALTCSTKWYFLCNFDVGCSSPDLSGVESFCFRGKFCYIFSINWNVLLCDLFTEIPHHHLNSSAEKWPSIPDTWDSLFLTSLRKAFGTETCVWKSKPKISWMLVLPQSTLVNISNFLYTFSGAFTCYHLSFDRPEKAISYVKAISYLLIGRKKIRE